MNRVVEGALQLVFAVCIVLIVRTIMLGALRYSLQKTRNFIERRRQQTTAEA